MKHALPILLVAACVTETPPPDGATTAPRTFAQDTYYSGIIGPYATPEACLAAAPGDPATSGCTWELGFCASGQVSLREGDVAYTGGYQLDGTVANAALQDHQPVQFDVTTDQATGTLATWIPDTIGRWMTEDFDVGACPDETP
jgi:hypothetical protein